MILYGIKDEKIDRFLSIFPCENDIACRRAVSSTLYHCDCPIGLNDRYIYSLGEINMSSGAISKMAVTKVCCVLDLFNDVISLRKTYEKK